MPKTIVVLGARNLGGAIVDHFQSLGWNTAAVAQSQDTLEAVAARGALAVKADASDPDSLSTALGSAARAVRLARRDRQRGHRRAPAEGRPVRRRRPRRRRPRRVPRLDRGRRRAGVRVPVGRGGRAQGRRRRRADPGHRRLLAPRDSGQGAVGGGGVRHQGAGPGRRAGAALPGRSTWRCSPSTRRSSRPRRPPSPRASHPMPSATWVRSPRRWRSSCSSARARSRTSSWSRPRARPGCPKRPERRATRAGASSRCPARRRSTSSPARPPCPSAPSRAAAS